MRSSSLCALACALACALPARAQDLDASPFDDPAPAAVPVLSGLSPRDARVLLGEDLIRRGYRSLGEALAFEAGFSRERTSRGYRYVLRGVPAGALLVVDGVPQVVDGERDVLDVDDIVSLIDVDRVEIVRGPATALSGAGALSGVVHVTTTKPGLTGAGVRVAGGWLAGEAPQPGAQEIAAHGTLRDGDLGLRASARLWGGAMQLWRVRGAPTRYETIAGVTLPVTKEAVNVVTDDEGATARVVGQWGDFVLDGSVAHHVERSPISAFSHGLVLDAPQTVQRDIGRVRALFQRFVGPVHVASAAFAGQQARVDEGALFPTRGVFTDGGELRVNSDVTTGGAVVRVHVPVVDNEAIGAHRLVLGALGDVTSLRARGSSSDPRTGKKVDEAVSLDDLTATGALALEWQADLGGSWHATAGVAGEVRTALGASLAPRASLAWTPADVALRVSYAEGTRAPDRYDVVALAQTVVDGRAAGAGSNKDLRPEHVRTLEVGAGWSPSPLVVLDARAFGMLHEDALTDVVERGLLVPRNIAPRLVVGSEASGAVSPWHGDALALEGALAVARTVDGPSIDADLLQATAGARAIPVEGLRCGVRGRALYRGVPARARSLLDAWVAVVPNPSLAVTLSLTNVLDANELSVDREAPPQADPGVLLPGPGRTLTLSVEGRL